MSRFGNSLVVAAEGLGWLGGGVPSDRSAAGAACPSATPSHHSTLLSAPRHLPSALSGNASAARALRPQAPPPPHLVGSAIAVHCHRHAAVATVLMGQRQPRSQGHLRRRGAAGQGRF
jgi:hypothetical protein